MTSQPLRVCIVEDVGRLRELLQREISAMGFSAVAFRTAADAWPALARGDFHVVILDLNLPGEDGMSLFQRLHDHDADLAVVVLTGFGTLESAVQALRWGAADYLTKPCSLDQIEAVLTRIDRRRRAHAAKIAAPDPTPPAPTSDPPAADVTLADLEREQIVGTLARFDGDKRRAARALGISLRTLYNRLHAYRTQGRLHP